MNQFRLWYRSAGDILSEDFPSHRDALSFAHGLLLLGGGTPLDIRDSQSGELLEDFCALSGM